MDGARDDAAEATVEFRARHHVGVPLLVDTASAVRRLDPDEFARWAAIHTVFLSSEMRALGVLRAAVADTLRQAGFSVVIFETSVAATRMPSGPT